MHVLAETDDAFISEESAAQVTEAFEANVVADHEPGRNFLQLEAPPETTPTAFARNLHSLRSWIGGPFRGERAQFDSRIVFNVGVPGRFDLDIELNDGAITVDEVFEGDVKIHTQSADVFIAKLKSMYIDIDAEDGDVSLNTVHGNLSVRSSSGHVDIGRIQGPAVRLVTDSGDVQVRAMYADYAMLRSRTGTVRLGGAQGYTKVRTVEGDVEVAGVEGRLDVESDTGDVEAKLSVPRTVSMRSRHGDIAIGLPDLVKASFLFEGGNTVDVDKRIAFHRFEKKGDDAIVRGEVRARGEDEADELELASVHARAPCGDVTMTQQGWGATLYSLRTEEEEAFPRWVQYKLWRWQLRCTWLESKVSILCAYVTRVTRVSCKDLERFRRFDWDWCRWKWREVDIKCMLYFNQN